MIKSRPYYPYPNTHSLSFQKQSIQGWMMKSWIFTSTSSAVRAAAGLLATTPALAQEAVADKAADAEAAPATSMTRSAARSALVSTPGSDFRLEQPEHNKMSILTSRMIRLALASTAAMVAACAPAAPAAQLPETAEALAAKGRETATLFPGLGGLCDLSMVFRDVNAARPAGQPAARPAGEAAEAAEAAPPAQRAARGSRGAAEQQVAPMQVFDNLYFVGDQGVSAWVLGSEADGYILIDALTSDEAARAEIEGGMRKLGLDPRKIKYLLITHAHGDHFGGHKYILANFAPRMVMSEPDWVLASKLGTHPRFGAPPARDMSVKDGDRLVLGKTTLEIHVTPGHTPGTISPIFTVYDKGKPHRAALWGGTGFNFGPDLKQMQIYAASARSFKQVAASEGVDVFLSNHPARDGALEKMARLSARKPGEGNPFVMGKDSLKAFDVLHYCAAAQATRLASGAPGASQ